MTEEYLSESSVLQEVNSFAEVLEHSIRSFESDHSCAMMEVYLELHGDTWAYYIAEHQSCCIVWLEAMDLSWMNDYFAEGIQSLEHLRESDSCCDDALLQSLHEKELLISVEYFTHLERFPQHQTLPDGLLDELTGIILHGNVGACTMPMCGKFSSHQLMIRLNDIP